VGFFQRVAALLGIGTPRPGENESESESESASVTASASASATVTATVSASASVSVPDSASDQDLVVVPIEDSIDLHTFQPRDVASVVEEYLHEAQRLGLREVRVIHGRGKGVQRRIVQGVLERHPAVESFASAPATRGGWGATVVWLKARRAGRGRSKRR
jgi:DNA-nicking Smr family endonuclease